MKKPKQKPVKRFFIRKYVTASSVTEALAMEKSTPVDGIWAEKQETPSVMTELIGFRTNDSQDDDE